MISEGRLGKAERTKARHSAGTRTAPVVSLPAGGVVEFVSSEDYLHRPLFPRQATLLKVIFLELEQLTAFDHRVIQGWGSGFRLGEGDASYEGSVGMPPDVLDRMRRCREEGRSWFREVVAVIGRRGSKGYLGALTCSYVLWRLLAKGNPQQHYGLVSGKRLVGMSFAGEKGQAAGNLFRDLADVIRAAPCFAPFISTDQTERLTLFTPHDLATGASRRNGTVDAATVQLDARASTSGSGRGPAAFFITFDEMAHLAAGEMHRSADELYSAATPALAQCGNDGLIYAASSPSNMTGQFHANFRRALAVHPDRTPVDHTMLTIQLPSWAMYEDYELTSSAGGLEMWPGGPSFPVLTKPIISFESVAGLERANRDTFAVEYRAQWRTALDAYLNPDHIDAMFSDWHGTQLHIQDRGRLGTDYVMHVDPSRTEANFAVAIGHRELHEIGYPHVVFDYLGVYRPKDFPDGVIDYLTVMTDLKRLIVAFAPAKITFDQWNSALSIDELKHWIASSQLHRRCRVSEARATRARNFELAERFKSALGLGLVHAPMHPVARDELLFLQYRNDVVDHPSSGPVQTSDLADCIFEVTTQLIGDDLWRHGSLGSLKPRVGLPGGLPLPTESVAESLSELGRSRRTRPGYDNPARSRRIAKPSADAANRGQPRPPHPHRWPGV